MIRNYAGVNKVQDCSHTQLTKNGQEAERSRQEEVIAFLIDTLPRHSLYLGQMLCGALRRTVLRLHQSLRRRGWVPGHVSTDAGSGQHSMWCGELARALARLGQRTRANR